jgi:uncharacterized protein (DUF58 family)
LMTSVTAKTLAKAYLIIVLLLAVLFSSPLQVGIALVLLAIQIYSAYKPPKPNLNLIFAFSSLVFAPLALQTLAGPVYAVLLMIPAVFLLDQSLKDNASTQTIGFAKTGRNATDVLKALALGLLLLFGASIVLWNVTLVLTATALTGYLTFTAIYIIRQVPRKPLQEKKTWSRIVAGDTDTKTTNLKAQTSTSTFVVLQASNSWVHLGQTNFKLLGHGETDVTLRFTPPLAGPTTLQLQATVTDMRGLITTAQVLEPVDLHIIPRAKYAQWLANKYLEQTSPGTSTAAAVPPPRSMAAKRGVEYHGSRPYQVGDRLKDIDWKHSYMLGELIVKEFGGAQGQTVIIAADLTAKDAEDADKLAHNLVMTALTLATEALPAALAVYNHKEVLVATPPENPRETLKKSLQLTQKITIEEPKEKVLEPTQILRLKRALGQLSQTKTEPAQKITELLEFEFEANQEAAKMHPATQALTKAIQSTQAPAVITVTSSIGYDSDALLLTLERLREKGYSTVIVS